MMRNGIWREHQIDLDALGRVRAIRLIQPLCNKNAKVISANAIAFECSAGVVVGWAAGNSARMPMRELPLEYAVRWSQLDHPTWSLRRSTWLHENKHDEMPELLVQDAAQFAAPIRSPIHILDAQLTRISRAHLRSDLWEVQGTNEAGDDPVWHIRSDQINFIQDGDHADNAQAIPGWLEPTSIVHVPCGESSFQRASFDGWPLKWRRAFAILMGLPSDAPVNCLSLLPDEVREHPTLSEWTCKAMALRIQSSASMRRQIKQLARPTRMNGVRPEHLEIWWPRWRAV